MSPSEREHTSFADRDEKRAAFRRFRKTPTSRVPADAGRLNESYLRRVGRGMIRWWRSGYVQYQGNRSLDTTFLVSSVFG
jgi:hypothetical protein